MKSLELTTSQVKRVQESKKGDTILLMFPIDLDCKRYRFDCINYDLDYARAVFYDNVDDDYCFMDIPIQKGDKDIFIQEEFGISLNGTVAYMSDYTKTDKSVTSNLIDIKDISEMTKEQSRYTISECIDDRVVRVQEIKIKEFANIINTKSPVIYSEFIIDAKHHYNTVLKEQNINRTCNDKDYVFLIEVKR